MTVYTLGMLEQAGKILFLLRKNTTFFSNYYGLAGGKVETIFLQPSLAGDLVSFS